MSGFLCKGCKTHGTCLDEHAIKSMYQKTIFDTKFEQLPYGKETIDFEVLLQQLTDMRGKEGYEERLKELALFIMKNSAANSPSSLRDALKLPASASFAAWSDETAKKELEFCNTRSLEQI